MLLSYNWLKQFIPALTETPEEVAEQLSNTLAEVEDVHIVEGDSLLEIENKALNHRADLFGQQGLAREVAASLRKKLEEPTVQKLDTGTGKMSEQKVEIAIENPELTPRYSAAIIEGVTVSESPDWLKEQLTSLGTKSINNVVDVTNYLMYKYGQPLHAFDVAKFNLADNETININIRQANDGENLTLLDDSELQLTADNTVIALQTSSDNTPVALAGIMGGKTTEVDDETTTVLLEVANFNMYSVRSSSRQHSTRSEASLRFEKGIDPELTTKVLSEAVEILTGNPVSDNISDEYPNGPFKSTQLSLELEEINYYLNLSLTTEDVRNTLEMFGFATEIDGEIIKTTTPSHRKDVTLKEDVLEEIGRVYDYNKTEPTLPSKTIHPPTDNLLWDFKYEVRDQLSLLGCNEALNYSFVPKELTGTITKIKNNQVTLEQAFDSEALELENPVAPEFSYMRSSLMPSIKSNVEENAKRFEEFGIYEIGLVTHPQENALPIEPDLLCIAYYSKQKSKQENVEHIKSIWVTLLNSVGIYNDLTLIEPMQLDLPNTKGAAFAYEIDVVTLFEQKNFKPFRSIPLSPATYQDISFTIGEQEKTGELVQVIRDHGGEYLEEIEITDIFQNDAFKSENRKSVTVRLTFQHPDQSLSDKEVTQIREVIEKQLVQDFDAVIR